MVANRSVSLRSSFRRYSAQAEVLVTVAALILAWQVATTDFGFGQPTLAAPSAIAKELFTRPGLYEKQTWVTVQESIISFALAAALGILISALITFSSLLQNTLYPVVLGLQVVPKVSIAPLLVIWFGFGTTPKIVLGALVALFPIIIDSYAGLRSADESIVDLVRGLNGSKWQEYRRVRFPNSLPQVFSGMKVGVTLAVVGVVIGELVNANAGLGYLVNLGNSQFNTPMAFAAIVLLAVVGIIMYGAVSLAERALIRWGSQA